MSDIYSQIVFNRTARAVTEFEGQRGRPSFTPAWILKITWDSVMAISYQKVNLSEVRGRGGHSGLVGGCVNLINTVAVQMSCETLGLLSCPPDFWRPVYYTIHKYMTLVSSTNLR